MKKFLLAAGLFATSFMFAQITLEHSFPADELVFVYTDENQTFYCADLRDSNIIKIYNSDYSLYKTITLQLPEGYNTAGFPEGKDFQFISKYIFNTDDKLEFLVAYSQNYERTKLQIINEDGIVIKDFDNTYWDYEENIVLFTDKTTNKNKLVLRTTSDVNEVYILPTSTLSLKEIQSNIKLTAFPIPTNTILNIINPENGAVKIEIYDMSGKLVHSQNFKSSQDRILLDVENLSKGNYVYKIGNLSSKFIKN